MIVGADSCGETIEMTAAAAKAAAIPILAHIFWPLRLWAKSMADISCVSGCLASPESAMSCENGHLGRKSSDRRTADSSLKQPL